MELPPFDKPIDSLRTCGDCPIKFRAVCSRCEQDELLQLEQIKSYRTYAAGEKILLAGDPMHWVGSIVVGIATLSKTLEDGRRQHVGLLFPSDFIGHPGRELAPYDVYASSPVTICLFERNKFGQLMTDIPHLASRLLEIMMDELDVARDWMVLLGRKTAREKLASLLVMIARRQVMLKKTTASDEISFSLPLNREDMSDYLGLTLETVSRQINALKKDGLIKLPSTRQLVIPDLGNLVIEAGDDSDGGQIA